VSQCDDPALEPDRLKMAAAIQRGIYTGHILVSETGNISLAPELESRFEALQVENYNEFEASEKVEEFLLSRPWPIVSDFKLRPYGRLFARDSVTSPVSTNPIIASARRSGGVKFNGKISESNRL